MSRSQKRVVPLVMIAVAAIGAIVFAQTGKKPSPGTSVQVNNDRKTAPEIVVAAAVTRKPLSYYTSAVRSDLFTPETTKVEVKKEPVVKVPLPTEVAPAPVNPLADFAYSGTIGMNGQLIAVIENVKTKTGQYLKQGDDFLGYKVTQITDRTVSLSGAAGSQIMAKSDDYKLAPLDKNAAYLQASNQPGAPGQPGVPGQPGAPQMGQGGVPGGGGFNWQNMTDEQRQQMRERFMNRQFNGGGRGGRGGGFGGGGFGGFGGRGRRGGLSGGAALDFGGM